MGFRRDFRLFKFTGQFELNSDCCNLNWNTSKVKYSPAAKWMHVFPSPMYGWLHAHVYMMRNGGSRVHRWRTRQLLGVIRNTAKLVINKERSLSRPSCSHMAIVLYLRNRKHEPCFYRVLYNNPSYSCILFGSCLWSIRGQTHDWRHHHKVFPSAVLKWRKVLRTKIIFYVTGQKIRYKKVLPRHWTGSRSQKSKDKAVSFREN